MRIIGAVLALLVLAACGTSLSTRHVTCMDTAAAFVDQIECVRTEVAADPYMRDDPMVREYLATGELLAAEVQRGRMDEKTARLQFIEKMNDIETEQRARAAMESQIERNMRDSLPRQTTCVPTGNGGQNCTTY